MKTSSERVAKLEELLTDLYILCYPQGFNWEVTDHTYEKYNPCKLCKKAHGGKSPCLSTVKNLTEECCKPFQAEIVADRLHDLGVEVDA